MTEVKEEVPYQVVAQVGFIIKRPEVVETESLEKLLWKEMPANNIGDNLFLKFPTQAFNFNINIQARRIEDSAPEVINVESKVLVEG